MSKIFNLKEWVTVADAAKHLSIIFDEEVTEADIYHFAITGKLTISVNFPNGVYAREGKVVPYENAKRIQLPFMKDGQPVFTIMGEYLEKTGEFIEFETQVKMIYGVYDLCMLHNEKFDIEWIFYNKISNINRDGFSTEGVFVKRKNAYFNLQESFEANEFFDGSRASMEKIEQYIIGKNITGEEAENLLNSHKKQREIFLEKMKSKPKSESYYPAGKLPEESILVVRTEALRDFESSVNAPTIDSQKSLITTERNTLLTIIAALCKHSKIKYQERGAPQRIARLTDEIEASVSDDTVRRWLAEIPDALEARMKRKPSDEL